MKPKPPPASEPPPVAAPSPPVRRHLPDERRSVTHRFTIDGHKGYVTIGLYEDGTPGEVFVRFSKDQDIRAWADMWAIQVSIALQYGIDGRVLLTKCVHQRFGPSQLGIASSPVDYIARWILGRFYPDGGKE